MKKVFWIALRELIATVCTKTFLIGLLLLPALIAIAFLAFNLFDDDFQASGRVALIDPTGRVTAEARRVLAGRSRGLAEQARQAGIDIPAGAAELMGSLDAGPELALTRLPDDADLEAEKRFLFMRDNPERRLALVVIHPDAIEAESGGELGGYNIYLARDLNDRETAALHGVLREAIVNLRFEASGYDRAAIERLTRVARGQSITVTETEEREANVRLNAILPAAFMFLLFMGIMGGGQGLMTSTIEEKSSRVVEVLLSAVSPMELMAGKLLGYMSISLIGMSIYLVAGLLALTSFSLLGLLEPGLIVYLFVFFFIAYFVVGSLMLAIGAAVNELREAQSLMMPVTIVLMLPWFLWMPIMRDPGSTLSVAASFIPPINTFGMLLRLSSTEPPPAWQVWASIGVGIVSVYAVLWCAARVFRIGLLLTGKPPNLGTLLRWIREG